MMSKGVDNLKRFKSVPFSFQVVGSTKITRELKHKWMGPETKTGNLL